MLMEEICHNVSTVDDNIVEDTELFIVSLTTPETMAIILLSSVMISVYDNDGKSISFYWRRYYCSLFFLLPVFGLQLLLSDSHKKSMNRTRVMKTAKCVLRYPVNI